MSIARRARLAFERFSPRVFLLDEAGAVTWAELGDMTARIAGHLRERGVRPGDRVLVALPNSRWCMAAYLATWHIGATLVAVNPALTPRELAYQIGHSRPRAIVASTGRFEIAREAERQAATCVEIWLCEGEAAGATDMRALPGRAPTPPAGDDHPAAILYTSGTTGRPKGAVLGHNGILWAQERWRDCLGLTEADVGYLGLPIFHSYGLILLFIEALLTGHAVVLRNGFEFPRFLRLLADHRVTIFPAVPPVYQAIASLRWDERAYDLSALRLIVSGAAPVPEATIRRAQERLGGPLYQEAYGITETSTIITCGPLGETPYGSCGRAVPGVEIQIGGRDGVRPPGKPGEVLVRTPGLMLGYLDDHKATEEALGGGWYHTGDVGYLDESGFLFLVDRLTDVILVNGENVYPREIEEVIARYPGVARCAVVRMKLDATGEAPHAFIVPEPGHTIRVPELMAYLRQHLAVFKLPRRVEIVDEIPTSPSGKILRRGLRA